MKFDYITQNIYYNSIVIENPLAVAEFDSLIGNLKREGCVNRNSKCIVVTQCVTVLYACLTTVVIVQLCP